ncbi:GNAT family N-acetyltransferase [Aestuariibacter halophilus]|uniref:GNAT family N-acetyltransferase n=1 Tax=Fluctibacter halophilus TaxID=226011 RepID=A0ABS8GBU8_9ALTE|nr:GNAT family N-acetyltransferase [Aestuariibacter halophilus]MCC2616681.1 GNAT family N-acetyltransferase [Aestuariibacter halophilus]
MTTNIPDNCTMTPGTHRQLLVIASDEPWHERYLCQHVVVSSRCWWFGSHAPQGFVLIESHQQYRHFLGQECDTLVIDARQQLPLTAAFALSGCVSRGGKMIVLCPSLSRWPESASVSVKHSYGINPRNPSLVIQWLCHCIQQDQDIQLITASSQPWPKAVPIDLPTDEIKGPCASSDQQMAVDAIVHVAKGHRHRPLVITADRGRGKTTALAIAALQLNDAHGTQCIITAPRPDNCATAIDYCQQHGQQHAAALSFVAMDKLIADKPDAGLVLIDEAASFPTALLQQVVEHYPRVVFCSTTHGYEGSGRGFEIRFKGFLHQHYPDYKSLHLNTPIRWYEGDPVEAFWFKAMAMTPFCEQPKVEQLSDGNHRLSAKQLIQCPTRLYEVFQLLLAAHYQTSPDDLIRLLDAPEQSLWVNIVNNGVTAVALCADEGDQALLEVSDGIASGQRRISGHLSAQQLCFTCAEPAYATLRYRRIVRIAVAPQHRRQGIATSLLAHIRSLSEQHSVDLLTTSFGLTDSLYRFWYNSQWRALKLGHKLDTASGERSILMGVPLQQDGKRVFDDTRTLMREDSHYHLPRRFKQMSPVLVCLLSNELFRDSSAPTARQLTVVQQVVAGTRAYHHCESSLAALLQHWLCHHFDDKQHSSDRGLLGCIALLLQGQPPSTVCKGYGFSGKKALNDGVRSTLEMLLSDCQTSDRENG